MLQKFACTVATQHYYYSRMNENEVSHLPEGIELQAAMAVHNATVLLPAGVRGAKAKPALWRGEQGVLPINTDSVTSFVREFMETPPEHF